MDELCGLFKDRVEYVMFVDFVCNDVNCVGDFFIVCVDCFMVVEKFSYV